MKKIIPIKRKKNSPLITCAAQLPREFRRKQNIHGLGSRVYLQRADLAFVAELEAALQAQVIHIPDAFVADGCHGDHLPTGLLQSG